MKIWLKHVTEEKKPTGMNFDVFDSGEMPFFESGYWMLSRNSFWEETMKELQAVA